MDDNRKRELENLPFEKALESLEATVAKMESGRLPLDEMMKFYEEGRFLSSVCSEKLKGVERKIEILRKGADGSPEWTEFSDDGSAARNAPAAPSSPEPPPADEPTLF
jgi:exodeoxyribonuclease VII small subunit